MRFLARSGHATWKFKYPDGRIYYRNSNKTAVGWFYQNCKEAFSIWTRCREGGWEYVCDNIVATRCQCGRLFTDTFNGLEFKWRDNMFSSSTTVEDCKKIFQAQDLCQVCYYKSELEAGRFCPKWVKQQLNMN
jgi:hypothetical protein